MIEKMQPSVRDWTGAGVLPNLRPMVHDYPPGSSTAEGIVRTLTEKQIQDFNASGYLLLEDAVSASQLAQLQRDMSAWSEESRAHKTNYGETINQKPRFDLDPTHSPQHPALRRINAPIEVSAAHFAVATDSRMVDAVADLIGPNVKLHHTKTNSKQPNTVTPVKYHQDFPFTPHSNDDVVTALLFLDDIDESNGALEVIPGSHRGPIYSIWSDGQFNGFIDEAIEQQLQPQAKALSGPAGSVCLMHTRLMHGSAPNASDRPRTLFICVYAADDAIPLSPNPMPHAHEGLLVRGERCIVLRTATGGTEKRLMRPGACSDSDPSALRYCTTERGVGTMRWMFIFERSSNLPVIGATSFFQKSLS
jgi:ectoine hydroxylase-related dioxygenase (phytanoyl-CoA dioxygenase family)